MAAHTDSERLALNSMHPLDARLILSDPEMVKRVTQVMLSRAAKARENILNFVEFVMVEEHTQKPLKIMPHQKVLLDFIMKHDRSVTILPVGASKTFSVTALTLYLLGLDTSRRGAIVSATQLQAKKPLLMVRDYIEHSQKLKAVFPHLRKSKREGDPWTQDAITVDRPVGIRDPSLIAVGVDGALAGARLNWIIVDDILTQENVGTKEQREKVYQWLQTTVISRLDPRGARIVICNTAWHPDDIVHRLEKSGWPTLRMGITGNIEVKTPAITWPDGRVEEDMWGVDDEIAEELRPATPAPYDLKLRLTAHDPDPTNSVPLWPERYPVEFVERKRREHLPIHFNQLFEGICRDDSTAKCQLEWVEKCKEKARLRGIHSFLSKYDGPNPTFTGLDLAVSQGEEHDDTAFFTFEVLPDGHRRILDIECGQFNGPVIIDKLFEKQKTYNSVVRVENNASQDFIRQFALQRDISIPVKPHTTGRTKAHPEHGVMGIFIEIYNGAWLIPNDKFGVCNAVTQRWIDAMLYYEPAKHTDDALMACWFAVEQARKFGCITGSATSSIGENLGANILQR